MTNAGFEPGSEHFIHINLKPVDKMIYLKKKDKKNSCMKLPWNVLMI